MGDVGDTWRAVKDERKRKRDRHGRPCPECCQFRPNAHPTILLPGQKCRMHDYRDPRDPEEHS